MHPRQFLTCLGLHAVVLNQLGLLEKVVGHGGGGVLKHLEKTKQRIRGCHCSTILEKLAFLVLQYHTITNRKGFSCVFDFCNLQCSSTHQKLILEKRMGSTEDLLPTQRLIATSFRVDLSPSRFSQRIVQIK